VGPLSHIVAPNAVAALVAKGNPAILQREAAAKSEGEAESLELRRVKLNHDGPRLQRLAIGLPKKFQAFSSTRDAFRSASYASSSALDAFSSTF